MEDILNSDDSNSTTVGNVTQDAQNTATPTSTNIPIVEDLDNLWLRWKCLVCGYVYEGVTPLRICPKCGNDDVDKFDDSE